MKIRIEIDNQISEDEVVIRSRQLDERVSRIQKAVQEAADEGETLLVFGEDKEYYLSLSKVLFFETEGSTVYAHTRDGMFAAHYRLYELEDLLPHTFMRVSKSAILNVSCVYSITRSIASACLVEFQDTHKQVYVSRYYYKPLRQQLEEKRKMI